MAEVRVLLAVIRGVWILFQVFSFIRPSEFRVPVLSSQQASLHPQSSPAWKELVFLLPLKRTLKLERGSNTCSGSRRKGCSQDSHPGLWGTEARVPANNIPGHLCWWNTLRSPKALERGKCWPFLNLRELGRSHGLL